MTAFGAVALMHQELFSFVTKGEKANSRIVFRFFLVIGVGSTAILEKSGCIHCEKRVSCKT